MPSGGGALPLHTPPCCTPPPTPPAPAPCAPAAPCPQAEAAPEDVPLDARPTGLFLVLTVQLKTEQLTTITREADGLVVAELK